MDLEGQRPVNIPAWGNAPGWYAAAPLALNAGIAWMFHTTFREML